MAKIPHDPNDPLRKLLGEIDAGMEKVEQSAENRVEKFRQLHAQFESIFEEWLKSYDFKSLKHSTVTDRLLLDSAQIPVRNFYIETMTPALGKKSFEVKAIAPGHIELRNYGKIIITTEKAELVVGKNRQMKTWDAEAFKEYITWMFRPQVGL